MASPPRPTALSLTTAAWEARGTQSDYTPHVILVSMTVNNRRTRSEGSAAPARTESLATGFDNGVCPASGVGMTQGRRHGDGLFSVSLAVRGRGTQFRRAKTFKGPAVLPFVVAEDVVVAAGNDDAKIAGAG